MPTLAASTPLQALEVIVVRRSILYFIPDSPLIERTQYELSYEISNKRAALREIHKTPHLGADLPACAPKQGTAEI
jgi:hypothetical protein